MSQRPYELMDKCRRTAFSSLLFAGMTFMSGAAGGEPMGLLPMEPLARLAAPVSLMNAAGAGSVRSASDQSPNQDFQSLLSLSPEPSDPEPSAAPSSVPSGEDLSSAAPSEAQDESGMAWAAGELRGVGRQLWQSLPQDQDESFDSSVAMQRLRGHLESRLHGAVSTAANAHMRRLAEERLPGWWMGGEDGLGGKIRMHGELAWQGKNSVLGEMDMTLPLYGTRDSDGTDRRALFLQPGVSMWEADNGERRTDLNLGLVYRMRHGMDAWGFSMFYDHSTDSHLARLGGGLDWVGPGRYASLQYYHPLTDWKEGDRDGYEEHALRGVEARYSHTVMDGRLSLEGSLGMWEGYDKLKETWDWEPGADMGLRWRLARNLSLHAEYGLRDDNVEDDRYSMGLEFSWPSAGSAGMPDGEADLWRVVQRQKRILFAERIAGPGRIEFSGELEMDVSRTGSSPSLEAWRDTAGDGLSVGEIRLGRAVLGDVELTLETKGLPDDNGDERKRTLKLLKGATVAQVELAPEWAPPSGTPLDTAGGTFTVRISGARLALGSGAWRDVSGAVVSDRNEVEVTVAAPPQAPPLLQRSPAEGMGQTSGAQGSSTPPTLTLFDPRHIKDPPESNPGRAEGGRLILYVETDQAVPAPLTLSLEVEGGAETSIQDADETDFGTGAATLTVRTKGFIPLTGSDCKKVENACWRAAVPIPIRPDSVAEPQEEYLISLKVSTNSSYALPSSNPKLAGHIIENEGIRVVFAANRYHVKDEAVLEGQNIELLVLSPGPQTEKWTLKFEVDPVSPDNDERRRTKGLLPDDAVASKSTATASSGNRPLVLRLSSLSGETGSTSNFRVHFSV